MVQGRSSIWAQTYLLIPKGVDIKDYQYMSFIIEENPKQSYMVTLPYQLVYL
jgi:hypothetical protein